VKTLFLLRHAKSSRKDQSLPDFERPLNRRGKDAAERIGRYLQREVIVPELVLSSPAVRARETIERVAKAAKWVPEVRFDQRIYEAGGLRLLEVVSQIENERKTALLVGHNPGIEELLMLLAGESMKVPTAALLKLELKSSKWATAADKRAKVAWRIKPSKLRER
jgi:phosphohistidine phosphatase